MIGDGPNRVLRRIFVAASMNPSLKRTLLTVLGNPLVKPFFWLACRVTGQHRIWLSFDKNFAEKRFLDTQPAQPAVLAGPFAGLKYSVIRSVGSVLAPKILGTYEQELFPVWNRWMDRGYTDILDIGCAEGFYAVGMARLWPIATVHAYDIDTAALELCRQLARTNAVSERVRVEGACTPETLRKFPFHGRALILSDCEGYEAQLFTAETLPALATADIVIEVHEQAGSGFMEKVEALAAATHKATRIRTQPRRSGESVFLSKYSDFDQVLILSEARDSVLGQKPQWWLVLESRT